MTLEELVNQLKTVLAESPGEELQKNLHATLAAGLARMDVVTRQEFEIQRALLDAMRERVDALTRQIEALETSRSANKKHER